MQIANIGGLDRILNDHDDGMVAKTIVYVNFERVPGVEIPEDLDVDIMYAYADSECTRKFTAAELVDAFIKGCIVRGDGVYMHPIQAMDAGFIVVTVEHMTMVLIAGDADISMLF